MTTQLARETTGTGDGSGNPIPALGIGVAQNIALTGAAAQSSVVPAGVSVVEITASVDFHIAYGANPTAAAATSCFRRAGGTYYTKVLAGQRFSVIKATGALDGFVTITHCD